MKYKRIRLANCDAGVNEELKNYKFIEAIDCACASCQSSEVSCEGMGYDPTSAPFR